MTLKEFFTILFVNIGAVLTIAGLIAIMATGGIAGGIVSLALFGGFWFLIYSITIGPNA